MTITESTTAVERVEHLRGILCALGDPVSPVGPGDLAVLPVVAEAERAALYWYLRRHGDRRLTSATLRAYREHPGRVFGLVLVRATRVLSAAAAIYDPASVALTHTVVVTTPRDRRQGNGTRAVVFLAGAARLTGLPLHAIAAADNPSVQILAHAMQEVGRSTGHRASGAFTRIHYAA